MIVYNKVSLNFGFLEGADSSYCYQVSTTIVYQVHSALTESTLHHQSDLIFTGGDSHIDWCQTTCKSPSESRDLVFLLISALWKGFIAVRLFSFFFYRFFVSNFTQMKPLLGAVGSQTDHVRSIEVRFSIN